MSERSTTRQRVTIIGAGSIGLSFAIAFARGGWEVVVADPEEDAREAAPSRLRLRLETEGEFSGSESFPAWAGAISYAHDFAAPADTSSLVLECAPESIEVKADIFSRLDAVCGRETILASASSALTISQVAQDLAGRDRAIIAHPANPPHLIPLIELVPADFTSRDTLNRANEMFLDIGMTPVVLKREIEGFVMNRLQGALLREAYFLVRDGVADVEDVDTVVRAALGLRWAVSGPFETADLNTQGGIESHARKLGPTYARFGRERGLEDPWTPAVVGEVSRQRRQILPSDQWDSRVLWREREIRRMRSIAPERFHGSTMPPQERLADNETRPPKKH